MTFALPVLCNQWAMNTLDRRDWIRLGAGVILAPAFAPALVTAAEVWEKPASEWSAKDIEKLMNKSPWAKKDTVDTGRGPAAFSGVGPGGGRAGGGGRGGAPSGPQGGGGDDPGVGGGGDFGGGGGGMGGGSAPEALVRWETALPILEAQKRTAPEAFAGHYAISVTGFPLGGGRPPGGPGGGGPPGGGPPPGAAKGGGFPKGGPPNELLEKAKETTRLERKGKDPIHPDVLTMAQGRALILLFPHGTQPITVEDKEIQLYLQIGLPILKIKFNLKDMVYRGKLEL